MLSKRILVFSGARSEFFILSSLIDELVRENCHVTLLVAASHYVKELSGAEPYYKTTKAHDLIELAPTDQAFINPTNMLADLIDRLARIEWSRYDLCVVLGDRYEALGFSICTSLQRKLLVHLHGGEKTVGSYDDSFRHAITKLSHYHFVACEEYALRVIQLGEDPKCVFNYGAIGTEAVVQRMASLQVSQSTKDLVASLGEFLLVTLHPESSDLKGFEKRCEIFFQTLLETVDFNYLFTAPGFDYGYEMILQNIQQFIELRPKSGFVSSLGLDNYLYAARASRAVVGNSSSGIIELPAIGCMVLNYGDRQLGRVIPPGVRCINAEKKELRQAIMAIKNSENDDVLFESNPYLAVGSKSRIAKAIASIDSEETSKSFIDIR